MNATIEDLKIDNTFGIAFSMKEICGKTLPSRMCQDIKMSSQNLEKLYRVFYTSTAFGFY